MRELRNIRTPLAMAVTLASATMMLGTDAQAQGQKKAAALEEVVVTARKREESLQDLGQSVSAFSAAEIENRFAGNIDNLTDISPNLVIDDTAQGPGGVAAIYIRGIGVAEVESSFDPAVGVVVDGMFLGKASGSLTQLIDVERIEVLRGPQGTLFGRNSIGGVINIARMQPTHELSGKARLSYGNYDTTKFDGYTSFGLTDNLALKLNYSKHDQGEGYFQNLTTNTDNGEVEYEMYGAHLLWNPTTDLELEYSYTEEQYDQDTPPIQNVSLPGQLTCDAFNFCAPDASTPISGDRYQVVANGRNDASFDAQTHIAKANWIINDQYSVDYIFGYRETEEEVFQDWDATPLTLYHTSRPEDYEQTSNELRLNFSGDRLNYVVGLYQFNMEYTIDLLSFIGFFDPTNPIDVPQTVNQETDTYAAFFEADYNLTDKWVLTLGGRYGTDEKSTHVTNDLAIDMPSPVEEDWSEFTPKVGLKYFASPELMVYGLYSSGYRAGGFSGRPTTQEAAEIPYDPETVDNLEAGFKSEWLNQSLRINGAIFYMEYDDKQEEQSVATEGGTGQQTIVANVASAKISGIEMDFVYLPPVDGLELSGNFGYLDAEYEDFIADIGRGGVTNNDDLELRRAPEFTGSLAVKYEWNIGQGTAWSRVGWHYIGEHHVSLLNSPQTENDAQSLIDASVNYELDSWKFSVFGRNLTEEDGYTVGFDVGGLAAGSLFSYAATRAPRTFGAQVEYTF